MNNVSKIDFVIPLCKNNIFFKTVLQGILQLYQPNKIYIITNIISINELKKEIIIWGGENIEEILVFLDEDIFFVEKYNLLKCDIEKNYIFDESLSREFGWWYQQILKLGAVYQIPHLSDPFVIWDGDLIPIIKWELKPNLNCTYYKFAILQEKSKSEWNKEQYALTTMELIGLEAVNPNEGTFVPHHFIFHHKVIKSMIEHIENLHNNNNNNNNKSWIELIIQLFNKYYRFSEYKCVATYMNTFYKELLQYHDFHLYGKTGIRYRDSKDFVNKITSEYEYKNGISYSDFIKFIKKHFSEIPSYIQIEDV
jgi:hypothetical protein